MVPDLLKEMPKLVQNIFGSAVTVSGLIAITLNTLLPYDKAEVQQESDSELNENLETAV